jgi:hypothetical protein
VRSRQALGGFVGLAVIGVALAWLLYLVVRFARQLDPNVVAAIIAAMAATAGAIYSQRKARIRDIEDSHRLAKIEVYNVFMDIIDATIGAVQGGTPVTSEDGQPTPQVAAMFVKLRRDFVFWASPGVIQSFEKFRKVTGKPGASASEMVLMADEVFAAMRKDLRNSNWGLRKGQLMGLYLKDPDELAKPVAAKVLEP